MTQRYRALQLAQQEALIKQQEEAMQNSIVSKSESNMNFSDDPQQKVVNDWLSSNERESARTAKPKAFVPNDNYYNRNEFKSAQDDYLNRVDKQVFDVALDRNFSDFIEDLRQNDFVWGKERDQRKQIGQIQEALEDLKNNGGSFSDNKNLSAYGKRYAKMYWQETMDRATVNDDRKEYGLDQNLNVEFGLSYDSPIGAWSKTDIFRYMTPEQRQQCIYNVMHRMRNEALSMDDNEFYDKYKFNKNQLVQSRSDAAVLAGVNDVSPNAITSIDRINWSRLNASYSTPDPVTKQVDLKVGAVLNYGLWPPLNGSNLKIDPSVPSAGDGDKEKKEKKKWCYSTCKNRF